MPPPTAPAVAPVGAPVAPPAQPAEDAETWPRAVSLGVAVGLLTLLGGLMFWSVAPHLAGWRSQVVLTGSMQPRIHPGDLVLAAPVARGELKPGRVILFRDPVRPGRTIVHRLVRYDDTGNIVTKGDANRSEDSTPVAPSAVLGLPRLRVPYIGRPVVWMHEGNRQALLISLVVLGIGGTALLWPMFVTPSSPPAARRTGDHRR